MDDRSFRVGNRLVGNAEGTAGLEVTLTGPRLRFDEAAVVAVTGAPLAVELDGVPVEQWARLEVPGGGVLKLGAIRGVGLRAYVLVQGGISRSDVMGSRSVFAAASLGGGPARRGDVLDIGPSGPRRCCRRRLSPPRSSRTSGRCAWSPARTARPTS